MKLSACRSSKSTFGVNKVDLNIKGPSLRAVPEKGNQQYITLHGMSKDDLLQLACFAVSLARSLPERKMYFPVALEPLGSDW